MHQITMISNPQRMFLNLSVTKRQSLKITERDLSIIEFLLEMKFAGFEEIYEKFFPEADTLFWGYSHWCRDRMKKLRLSGLVRTFTVSESLKRYFVATEKGRRVLVRERPFISPPWALKKPQIAFFDHDFMVLKIRLKLESENLIQSWISERSLRIAFGDYRELSIEKHNIPDGIFIESLAGRRVALELEMTQKATAKYREKLKYQVSIMRSKSIKNFEFDQVLYLCKSKGVAKVISEESRIYGDLFKVQTLEEFFSNRQA